MIIKGMHGSRWISSHRDTHVGAWQLTVLVICIVASIVSGVGAYAFLSATRPAPNRVSWSLEPPKSARTAARVAAPGNLQAVAVVQRRHMRDEM